LFATAGTAAVKTGSFNVQLPFQGGTRTVSVYVPPTYDSTQPYRLMIALHGLGDNSANYRSALISSLGWGTHFPRTIFVCPEALTTSDDFYDGQGGEAIIDSSMRYAMSTYHIDTGNVILQGFSLGGRAALKYGLEHTAIFKGLLLNTPAIQGVKNALNLQPAYTYAYENASRMPIYLTHGQTDIFYTGPIDSMIRQLVLNDPRLIYRDVPNMGHSIPTFPAMSDVLQFFDNPARAPKDVAVYGIDQPVRTCGPQIAPKVLIQNAGSTSISAMRFDVTLNGNRTSYTWNRDLAPYQHAFVDLQPMDARDSMNTLTVTATTIDGFADTVTFNSSAADTFVVQKQAVSLPMTQGFEGEGPGFWAVQSAGDLVGAWSADNTVGRNSSSSIFNFNTIFAFDNLGRSDALLSPVVDLTTTHDPVLSFDLAYNYHRYTPPYTSSDVDLADTLRIAISTDCGATWTQLLNKAGAELATFDEPIVNPLSIDQDYQAPADSNWRHMTIDLGSFAAAQNATVKFEYVSGLGGFISMDNISIAGASGVANAAAAQSVSISPNPASDRVLVQSDGQARVRLVGVSGIEYFAGESNGELTIDTHALPNGIYILHLTTAAGERTEKIVVRHP
jgi:predicted esterase